MLWAAALWLIDQRNEPASQGPKIQFPQMELIMLFLFQLNKKKRRRNFELADSIFLLPRKIPLSCSRPKVIVPSFKMSRERNCKIP